MRKNEKIIHEILKKTGRILHKSLPRQKNEYEKHKNAAAAKMENRNEKQTENRRTATKKA